MQHSQAEVLDIQISQDASLMLSKITFSDTKSADLFEKLLASQRMSKDKVGDPARILQHDHDSNSFTPSEPMHNDVFFAFTKLVDGFCTITGTTLDNTTLANEEERTMKRNGAFCTTTGW